VSGSKAFTKTGKPRLVRGYDCCLPKWEGCYGSGCDFCDKRTEEFAFTAGQARYRYLLSLWDSFDHSEVSFRDVRVRAFGLGRSGCGKDIARVAEYRGVPFVRPGMRVEVAGSPGRIVGVNSSANFDVVFDDGSYGGFAVNCHPLHKMRYFDEDGTLLFDTETDLRKGA
jgi:hypothetical protein